MPPDTRIMPFEISNYNFKNAKFITLQGYCNTRTDSALYSYNANFMPEVLLNRIDLLAMPGKPPMVRRARQNREIHAFKTHIPPSRYVRKSDIVSKKLTLNPAKTKENHLNQSSEVP